MGATKQAKGRVGKRQRRQAAPQGTAGAGRAVRKKANTQIIQATATAAFRVAFAWKFYSTKFPQKNFENLLQFAANCGMIKGYM